MRIVSLAPEMTELVCYFGQEESLVAVSARCHFPESIDALPKVTREANSTTLSGATAGLATLLGPDFTDVQLLTSLSPDLVLTKITGAKDNPALLARVRQELSDACGKEVRVFSAEPLALNEVYDLFESVAKEIGVKQKGHDLAARLKAQVMDWGDNFYDRMKNKKVAFLASVTPPSLAGFWIPDLIHLCSAISQVRVAGKPHYSLDWKEIVDFRPDVIVVAPEDFPLEASMKTFKILEKLPNWDDIPAVKRGEVIFTDGLVHFYRPGPRLIDSMGILISAIAGLESGYITARDSFYRLRWMELQRHRI
jgi:iron complex transport system substrate-binding protein